MIAEQLQTLEPLHFRAPVTVNVLASLVNFSEPLLHRMVWDWSVPSALGTPSGARWPGEGPADLLWGEVAHNQTQTVAQRNHDHPETGDEPYEPQGSQRAPALPPFETGAAGS
jgi:hypothetical protein